MQKYSKHLSRLMTLDSTDYIYIYIYIYIYTYIYIYIYIYIYVYIYIYIYYYIQYLKHIYNYHGYKKITNNF